MSISIDTTDPVQSTDPSTEDLVEQREDNALARIARAPWFSRLILVAIVVTGLLSGLETYPAFRSDTAAGQLVDLLQHVILGVFVAEIVIKVGAYGNRPWRYFQVPWNVFDFLIVVFCLMPLGAEYVVVFRLLRMLRLFTALPGLQILVSGLLRGIPSLGYVGLLLLLHFYIYAVIGTFAFGDNDPVRFATLHTTMLTLFQVLTLEGWNDILATQYLGSEVAYDDAWKVMTEGGRTSIARPVAAAAYFVSFILIGTMIMLNLFTGVIIRSMEEAHVELEENAQKQRSKSQSLPSRQEELQQLGEQLQAIAKRLGELHLPQAGAPRPTAGPMASPGTVQPPPPART